MGQTPSPRDIFSVLREYLYCLQYHEFSAIFLILRHRVGFPKNYGIKIAKNVGSLSNPVFLHGFSRLLTLVIKAFALIHTQYFYRTNLGLNKAVKNTLHCHCCCPHAHGLPKSFYMFRGNCFG